MHHSTFIGYLASIYRPANYVELGLYEGETFRLVHPHAKKLIGVDMKLNSHTNELKKLEHVEIHECKTDDFFANFIGVIDMAFIDADHRFSSVKRDFDNILSRLNPGGVILLHDTDPENDTLINPMNCGDSFKIVSLLEKRDDINVLTFPLTEAGLTLVTRKNSTRTQLRQKATSKKGWLINDCLTCIPGSKTLWNYLLAEIPGLEDKTNGYTDYSILADKIETDYNSEEVKPKYIIRNGTYFRKLNINVPTFCLIQDTQYNPVQTEVINSCDVVVFPSKFTYDAYKDRIQPKRVEIIQNGADFDFFKPLDEKHPDVLPNSIIFIGDASIGKKGFPLVLDTIHKMSEMNFCLIMKDDSTLDIIPYEDRERVRMFNKVPMETVRLLINSSVCAICTSGNEEEHISGIEIGACNIPMVTRPVGRYSDDRNDIEWGVIAADNEFPEKIRFVLKNRHLFSPRSYYSTKYSTALSMKKWGQIIKDYT